MDYVIEVDNGAYLSDYVSDSQGLKLDQRAFVFCGLRWAQETLRDARKNFPNKAMRLRRLDRENDETSFL